MLDAISPQLLAQDSLDTGLKRRLIGRHGSEAPLVLALARPGELETIPGTNTLWVELRWAARCEGVVHLDDLLLRRVRIGLLLPEGGMELMPRVREIVQSELGWANARWDAEAAAYADLWARAYGVRA
jgi:glycerol-3-phosphate dehydrogenase